MAHGTQGDRFASLLTGTTKDTGEQPDGETYRVRSGKGPSTGTPVPAELGYITPPSVDVLACVEAPQTPSYLDSMDFDGGLFV